MDPVDGNAIGGLLIDVFGTEMTAASSTCAVCGARRPVAELVVPVVVRADPARSG